MSFVPPDAENIVEIRRFASEPLFDPWAEAIVPDFPISTLPKIVAEFVCSTSDLIGCDPAGLAMASLTTLGVALDHRFGLKIMRHNDWWASPRLWVLLSGDPSCKKSPTIKAATRELEIIQSETFKAWLKEVEAHKAAGLPEDEAPQKPPRHVVNDTTVEKLGDILGDQPRGILSKQDELSGWIGSMERYASRGGGADRAFWLQAYDGGSYYVARIARGDNLIENLSVSVLGGIQPGKLAEMKDQTTDGLLQRFIPVILKAPRFPLDHPGNGTEAVFGRLIRKLITLEPASLIMEDAALDEMGSLRRHIFNIEQASSGLAAGFQAFAGKLPGMAASIALILHLAADPVHARFTAVSLQTLQSARRIVEEFVLPHAFEFYRTAETTTDGDRIKKLASYVLTCGKQRILTSDLKCNVASFRDLGMSEVNARVSPLVACGWLTPEGKDPIARAWTIEQAVSRQFVDRRRIEDQRKSALAALMKNARKGVAK